MTAVWRVVGKVLVVALTVGVAATAGQAFYAWTGSVQAPALSDRRVVPSRPAGAPWRVAAAPPRVRSRVAPPPAPAPPAAPAPQPGGPAAAPALAGGVPQVPTLGPAAATLRASRPRPGSAVDADRDAGRAPERRTVSDCRHDGPERAGLVHSKSSSVAGPGVAANEPDGPGEGARRALSDPTREPPSSSSSCGRASVSRLPPVS